MIVRSRRLLIAAAVAALGVLVCVAAILLAPNHPAETAKQQHEKAITPIPAEMTEGARAVDSEPSIAPPASTETPPPSPIEFIDIHEMAKTTSPDCSTQFRRLVDSLVHDTIDPVELLRYVSKTLDSGIPIIRKSKQPGQVAASPSSSWVAYRVDGGLARANVSARTEPKTDIPIDIRWCGPVSTSLLPSDVRRNDLVLNVVLQRTKEGDDFDGWNAEVEFSATATLEESKLPPSVIKDTQTRFTNGGMGSALSLRFDSRGLAETRHTYGSDLRPLPTISTPSRVTESNFGAAAEDVATAAVRFMNRVRLAAKEE